MLSSRVLEDLLAVAGLDVPDPHRAVIGRRGQQASVAGPGEVADAVGVAAQRVAEAELQIRRPTAGAGRFACGAG
jgi:hypothetical protein